MEYVTHLMAVIFGMWAGFALAVLDYKRREVKPERMLDLLDRAYLAGAAQKLARTPEIASAELYRLLREKTRAVHDIPEPYRAPVPTPAADIETPVETLEFSGSVDDFEFGGGATHSEMRLPTQGR